MTAAQSSRIAGWKKEDNGKIHEKMVEETKINMERSQKEKETFITTFSGHRIQRHNPELQLSLCLSKLHQSSR